MIQIITTDKILSNGISHEVLIDGKVKAYLILEKDKNELHMHISGMIPIADVKKILDHIDRLKEHETIINSGRRS